MTSKEPQKKGKQRKGDRFIQQMGLFSGDMDSSDDDEDIDLEAELKRLEANDKSASGAKGKQKGTVLDIESMKKLASTIDISEMGSDDNCSGSDDEEDLMKELQELTSSTSDTEMESDSSDADIANILQSRLDLYKSALTSADTGAKKRRFERAIKTIEGQVKCAKLGERIDMSEIPPEISVNAAVKISTSATPQVIPSVGSPPKPAVNAVKPPKPAGSDVKPPKSSDSAVKPPKPSDATVGQLKPSVDIKDSIKEEDTRIQMLTQRRSEYHLALVKAKKDANEVLARRYLSIRKNFDHVISAINDGQEVDLSNIPPSLSHAANQSKPEVVEVPKDSIFNDVAPPSREEAKALFGAPESLPQDAMSALQQRLKKYQDSEKEAKEMGNDSKARRMGRIVKQYVDAIKACKGGKSFDYSELPTPPGFAEIPPPGSPQSGGITSKTGDVTVAQSNQLTSSVKQNQPVMSAQPITTQPVMSAQAEPAKIKPKRQASLSIQEKQLATLKQRQVEYKKAALEAKTHDNRDLALKFLRISKGMDAMITAATNGLPVDMSQIPPQPATSHTVGCVMVEASEIADIEPKERVSEFEKIMSQIRDQTKRSAEAAVRFKALGDIKNAFVFENLQQNSQKDLDAVQNAFRNNDPVPKYHYETKKYSIVRVNTELGDGDLHVNIVKGLNYQLPSEISSAKDLDTHVSYEFPWPQDDVQKGRTDWSRHSDSPEYNHITKFKIDRKSKSMLRMFKSRKLKLELYYRRGFLKSDKQFSTVLIKLDNLERVATVHESFDLLDTNGRKEIGGTLEVILKMREPLCQKQIEMIEEKWLTIDQFVRLNKPVVVKEIGSTKSERRSVGAHSTQSVNSLPLQSLEVLRFEKSELDTRIRQLSRSGQLTSADLEKLTRKSIEMASQMDVIASMMKSNQLSAHEYVQILSQLSKGYDQSILTAKRTGDKKRHLLLSKKKDIITREIRVWQAKMNS